MASKKLRRFILTYSSIKVGVTKVALIDKCDRDMEFVVLPNVDKDRIERFNK